MTMFTRRTLVKGGTAAAAAGALTGPALLEWAKAWAQAAPWKPERGAQLSMLRWKYFVQSEDDAFVKLMEAFTQATGVKVNISREVLRGRAAEGLGRRQHRRRSGPVLGPLFAAASVPAEMRRCHRRRRLSRQEIRRLGAERRDIRQERQQVDRHSGLLQRQPDELPHRSVEEGRLLEIPHDHRRVPRIRQGDEDERHAGRLGARPRLGRRQWLDLLVPVVAWRQRRRQERQGHHQLAGDREGAQLRQGALCRDDPGHGLVERRLQQQGVPRRRDPLDQQRHLDLRRGTTAIRTSRTSPRT